jgi:hypothetical protein
MYSPFLIPKERSASVDFVSAPTKKMIRLTIPNYFLISASEALFKGKYLDASDASDIKFPPEITSTLTWIMAIPALKTLYGEEGVTMDVEITQQTQPVPSIDPELGVSVVLDGVLASFAFEGRSLFSLLLNVKVGAIASIEQNRKTSFLEVTFTEASVDVELVSSDPELGFARD